VAAAAVGNRFFCVEQTILNPGSVKKTALSGFFRAAFFPAKQRAFFVTVKPASTLWVNFVFFHAKFSKI